MCSERLEILTKVSNSQRACSGRSEKGVATTSQVRRMEDRGSRTSIESQKAGLRIQQSECVCVRFEVELDIVGCFRFLHLTIKANPHTHVKVSSSTHTPT